MFAIDSLPQMAAALAAGLLVGIPGLAPVAFAALTLYTRGAPLGSDSGNHKDGVCGAPNVLKFFKGELRPWFYGMHYQDALMMGMRGGRVVADY